MKRRKYFGFTALLAAMLTFVGCEDFESDLAYYVEFGETTYEIVGINEDNSVKVKILTEVIVDTLVNETMNNSTIELDGEECHANVEHASGSIYLLSATFDQVPLRKNINVITKAKGTYLNTENRSELNISGNSLVKVSSVKPLLIAPDTICLEVTLIDYKYLDNNEKVNLTGALLRDKDNYTTYSSSFSPSEIIDGKVLLGFVSTAPPAQTYSAIVYNTLTNGESMYQSCQVNIPTPTASVSNVQYYVDEMGMHITGNLSRGNLKCDPIIRAEMGNEHKMCSVSSASFHIQGIYPLYKTQVSVNMYPLTKGGQRFGESKTLSVTSTCKRYAMDMGGDVYWSVYNEGAVAGSYEGDYYLRDECEQDGYWRLPTIEELRSLSSNTTALNTEKYGIKGLEIISKSTGEKLFFPNEKFFKGSTLENGHGRYWLNDIYRKGYCTSDISRNYFTVSSSALSAQASRKDVGNDLYNARYVKTKNPIRVKAINLSHTNISTYLGCTAKLKPSVLPNNADRNSLYYSSSNPSVAEVSQTGVIIPHKEGECIITISSVEQDVKTTCSVNVLNDGSDEVDLGLSVKWRIYNDGAIAESDLGYSWLGYFALQNFKAKWKIPTKEQYQELLNKCDRRRITRNNVNGWLFTASNGNSIFMPTGKYWTRTSDYYYEHNGYSVNAYYLALYDDFSLPEIRTISGIAFSSLSASTNSSFDDTMYIRPVCY